MTHFDFSSVNFLLAENTGEKQGAALFFFPVLEAVVCLLDLSDPPFDFLMLGSQGLLQRY